MLSRFFNFFRHVENDKPSILMQQPLQSDAVSNLMTLPNGLILSGGTLRELNDPVNLVLYDPINKTQVASRRLESCGYPRFICMSNEWILIKCDYSDYQYVVNASTLQSDKTLEAELNIHKLDFYNGVYLGKQQFATLSCADKDNRFGGPYVIMVHDLSTMTFNQPASSILTVPEEASAAGIGSIGAFKELPNGLFACQVYGHNTSCFQVLLFKRDPGSPIRFTHIDTLYPEVQRSSSSAASGHFVGLSDGRILTYHESGNHFQIWQDGKCVDQWSWHNDVTCDDATFKNGFWTHNVIPLPDGEHLIIHPLGEKLFLFNIKNRVMKPVDLEDLALRAWNVKVCPNGQVALIMSDKQNQSKFLHIDLKEMIHYRQEVTNQLDSVGLYPDVNKLVTSYISNTSSITTEEEKPATKSFTRAP